MCTTQIVHMYMCVYTILLNEIELNVYQLFFIILFCLENSNSNSPVQLEDEERNQYDNSGLMNDGEAQFLLQLNGTDGNYILNTFTYLY